MIKDVTEYFKNIRLYYIRIKYPLVIPYDYM